MSRSSRIQNTDPKIGLLSSDEWVSVENLLETQGNRIGAISLGEQDVLKNGSVKPMSKEDVYIGEVEQLKGDYVVLNNELIDPVVQKDVLETFPTLMGPSEKNNAGFYLGNSMGSPIEIKLDHNIPETERWHTHTGYEVYKPIDGAAELGLGNQEFAGLMGQEGLEETDLDRDDIYVGETVEPHQYFAVPPNVPHKVVEKYNDPSLLIIRYTEQGDTIDKYWADGTPAYDWSEPDQFQIGSYQSPD